MITLLYFLPRETSSFNQTPYFYEQKSTRMPEIKLKNPILSYTYIEYDLFIIYSYLHKTNITFLHDPQGQQVFEMYNILYDWLVVWGQFPGF